MTLETQKPQTVLIVDDSPHNLQVLSELLIQQGLEVLVATDGWMAIEQAEYACPDLILLDVMMPQINGFETCRRLKSNPALHEIPIIFMTALSEASDRLQGFSAGGVDYITKPYQTEEVLARIKVHLQLRRLTTALAEKNQQLNEQNERLQQEIRERQQTEIALRESEERFRIMANSAPVLLWISNAAGQCTFFNDSWLTFTGRSLEQELGEGWATGVHPDDFAPCMQVFRTGLEHRQSFRMEYRLKRADGEYRWILDHGAPRFMPDGEFVGFIGSCVDISDRKRAEEELRQREAQFAAIAANVPGGVFRLTYHADGRHSCAFASEGYRNLFGIDPQELVANPSLNLEMVHPDDLPIYETAVAEAITGQHHSFYGEVRYCLPSGEVKWISTSAILNRLENGDVVVDGIDIDMTERKRTEVQLATQNELLSRIARGEPLSEILGAVIASVEQTLEGALCSVLLLDGENQLWHGAAPNLPSGYLQAVDGTLIGEGVGSCGTAAFRQQTVVTADIATDPLWQDFKEVALEYGLRACWSSPIRSSDGRVLGTFGVYYRQARSPHPSGTEVIEQMATIAGIAIEKDQAESDLRDSEERYRLLSEVSPVGIFRADLQGRCTYANAKTLEITGLSLEDNLGDEWGRHLHPDDYDWMYAAWTDFVQRAQRGEGVTYEVEHRYRYPNGQIRWAIAQAVPEHNAAGELVGFIGSIMEITDRKQAELALATAERQQRSILEHIPSFITKVDREGRVLFLNRTAPGLAPEQVMGKSINDFTAPESRALQQAALDQVFTTGETIVIETQGFGPNGALAAYEVCIAPIPGEGQVDTALAIATDITARKNAERELKQREAQLQAIAANLPGYLYRIVILPDGTCTMPYLSEGAEQIYGLSIATMTADQSQVHDLIHPDDRRMIEASIHQSMQTLVASSFEFRVRTRTGGWRWLHGIAQVHRTDDGNIVFDGVSLDINEKKQLELERQQSEAALRESETRFRQIAEAVQEGFFVAEVSPAAVASNRIYQYVYVSPSYEAIVGFSAAEVYANGALWMDFIHADDRNRVEAAFQRELQGEPFDEEYRYLPPNSPMCWIRAQAFPVRNEAGALVRVVGTIQDVSDRKQAEAQIRASLNEKEALLAEIHHRVKNNLQIISSLLNLQAYKIEDPQVRRALEDSWTRVDSMALVHETLYRSQDFSSINFADYLENLAQNLLNTYNTQTEQIDLRVEADAKIALSLNQAIPCGLIVNELITNALKHAFKPTFAQPGAREIIVHLTQTPNQHIQLRVGNSGNTLPDSFNPYQARSMGLQLVTNLVTQLDGTLTIEREPSDDDAHSQRTVFQITFDPLQETE